MADDDDGVETLAEKRDRLNAAAKDETQRRRLAGLAKARAAKAAKKSEPVITTPLAAPPVAVPREPAPRNGTRVADLPTASQMKAISWESVNGRLVAVER